MHNVVNKQPNSVGALYLVWLTRQHTPLIINYNSTWNVFLLNGFILKFRAICIFISPAWQEHVRILMQDSSFLDDFFFFFKGHVIHFVWCFSTWSLKEHKEKEKYPNRETTRIHIFIDSVLTFKLGQQEQQIGNFAFFIVF